MVTVEPSFPDQMTLEQRPTGPAVSRGLQFIQSKYDEAVHFFSQDIFRDAAERLDCGLNGSNPG